MNFSNVVFILCDMSFHNVGNHGSLHNFPLSDLMSIFISSLRILLTVSLFSSSFQYVVCVSAFPKRLFSLYVLEMSTFSDSNFKRFYFHLIYNFPVTHMLLPCYSLYSTPETLIFGLKSLLRLWRSCDKGGLILQRSSALFSLESVAM